MTIEGVKTAATDAMQAKNEVKYKSHTTGAGLALVVGGEAQLKDGSSFAKVTRFEGLLPVVADEEGTGAAGKESCATEDPGSRKRRYISAGELI